MSAAHCRVQLSPDDISGRIVFGLTSSPVLYKSINMFLRNFNFCSFITRFPLIFFSFFDVF